MFTGVIDSNPLIAKEIRDEVGLTLSYPGVDKSIQCNIFSVSKS